MMDWIAGSRLHLVDVVVTRGLVLLPLIVLGFDSRAVYAYLALVSFHAVFIHANFAPRAAWLERWIALPAWGCLAERLRRRWCRRAGRLAPAAGLAAAPRLGDVKSLS